MMVDTLTIARELRAADLPAGQAEAIAAAIGRSVSEATASKADLETTRIVLKSEIDATRLELKADIERLRADVERIRNQLLVGIIGSQIAIGGLIVALIKL